MDINGIVKMVIEQSLVIKNEDDINFVPLFRLNRVANNGVENQVNCK